MSGCHPKNDRLPDKTNLVNRRYILPTYGSPVPQIRSQVIHLDLSKNREQASITLLVQILLAKKIEKSCPGFFFLLKPLYPDGNSLENVTVVAVIIPGQITIITPSQYLKLRYS